MRFKAPQGTHDILPPESARWEALVVEFAAQCRRAGFGYVQTPTFEDLGVFQRMGEGTDVVRKEMYDFNDRSDPPHHLALRPEGTAGIVRAFNQHQPMRSNPQAPWKTWYAGPNFRYERPQKGRYRQFHQFGVEAIGSDDPDLDVEVIALLWDFYQSLGLRHIVLLLNTMGTLEERQAYLPQLQAFLRDRLGDLAEADRDNVEAHPMRVLDSKRRDTKRVTAEAPKLADTLSAQSKERFARVTEGLGALHIPFVLEPKLVRGLDYYTHTTFEFLGDEVDAAQSTIGAGGRYDRLAQDLGGDPAPGIGFATGVERILMACDAEDVFPSPDPAVDVFVVDVVDGTRARDLTHQLRRAGMAADRAFDGRNMRSQMKGADRSGAALAVIIGDDEVEAGEYTVRGLRGLGVQQRIAADDLLDHLRTRLDDPDRGGVPPHFYVENQSPQGPPGGEPPPEGEGEPSAGAPAIAPGGEAPAEESKAPGPSAPRSPADNRSAANSDTPRNREPAPEAPDDDAPAPDPNAVLDRARAQQRLEEIRRSVDLGDDT